jgi:hypothetical protein
LQQDKRNINIETVGYTSSMRLSTLSRLVVTVVIACAFSQTAMAESYFIEQSTSGQGITCKCHRSVASGYPYKTMQECEAKCEANKKEFYKENPELKPKDDSSPNKGGGKVKLIKGKGGAWHKAKKK